jgi:hypothetical protein
VPLHSLCYIIGLYCSVINKLHDFYHVHALIPKFSYKFVSIFVDPHVSDGMTITLSTLYGVNAVKMTVATAVDSGCSALHGS